MAQKQKQQLELVAGFVPSAVRSIVEKIAKDDDRTISSVVRKLLEESPRVKSALRTNGNSRRH